MPIALLLALAASLGIHAAALFGPEFDLAAAPEPLPLIAELRPLPPPRALPAPLPERASEPVPARPVKAKKPRRSAPATPPVELAEAPPAFDLPPAEAPAAAPEFAAAAAAPPEPAEPADAAPPPDALPAPDEPRLPPRGRIDYRVDRGDSNFEIGVARQEWQIEDGRYRLSSVIETTGLIYLFKPYRIDMESRGEIGAKGLRPDVFVIRRNGEVRERAAFDWQAMRIHVGDQAAQPLADGAQDLLSFNYELGFLRHSEELASELPITTGRKYGVYRLEVLGDEEIEVPAGVLRTLHLRAPGVNTTELWLAYDYLLLPVKIRHVDSRGGALVQVATAIDLNVE